MKKMSGVAIAVLLASTSSACEPARNDTLSSGETGGTQVMQRAEVARADGWEEHSHGKSAKPDYARLFPDDKVQRIDIVLTPEANHALLDDLRLRFGDPATRALSAGTIACQGIPLNAPCKFLGLEGSCSTRFGLGFTLQGGPSCRSKDLENPTDLVPGDPIAVPATIRYDGRVWNHVSLRFKGNSSLSRSWNMGVRKLGVKLDFDKLEDAHPEIEDQRFFGFGEMTFAPGYRDPSLLRDKLAADLLRDQGIVGARAAYYRLFVDGGSGPVYWGLYTMIEDPTDRLLSTHFGDDSGNLYKPDGPGADLATFDTTFLEKKKKNAPDDFRDFKRFFDALHAPRNDAAQWRKNLESVFDVDVFLRNMAFNRAVNHWDSYGTFAHNYYLYGDPTHGGRLVWIGWDHNIDWTGTFGPPLAVMMDNVNARQWPLIGFLVSDPVYRRRYRAFLEQSIVGTYEKKQFDARAKALHDLIAPYVVGSEGEKAPYSFIASPQSFTSELAAIISMADGRRAAIAQALAAEAAASPASFEP